MAGIRQHYIPRMLLRRFGDSLEQVRVLRRDGNTFLTKIGSIAFENEFYGKPGPGSADDAITQEETRIFDMLQEVTAAPEGSVDTRMATELIAHFTTRARSMRSFMMQTADIAIEEVGRPFSDGETVRAMLRTYIRDNPGKIVEDLLNAVLEHQGPAALAALLQNPAYNDILKAAHLEIERELCNFDAAAAGSVLLGLLSDYQPRFREIAKSAHQEVALSNPTPLGRSEVLTGFTFAVQDSTEDLILSDSVGWGVRTSVGVTPLYVLEADLQTVVMPVSRSRIILGWRGERPNFTQLYT